MFSLVLLFKLSYIVMVSWCIRNCLSVRPAVSFYARHWMWETSNDSQLSLTVFSYCGLLTCTLFALLMSWLCRVHSVLFGLLFLPTSRLEVGLIYVHIILGYNIILCPQILYFFQLNSVTRKFSMNLVDLVSWRKETRKNLKKTHCPHCVYQYVQ